MAEQRCGITCAVYDFTWTMTVRTAMPSRPVTNTWRVVPWAGAVPAPSRKPRLHAAAECCAAINADGSRAKQATHSTNCMETKFHRKKPTHTVGSMMQAQDFAEVQMEEPRPMHPPSHARQCRTHMGCQVQLTAFNMASSPNSTPSSAATASGTHHLHTRPLGTCCGSESALMNLLPP